MYLAHFRGQYGSLMQQMGMAPEPKEQAWEALTRPLGLAGATVGARVKTPDGAPPLAGVAEWAGQKEWHEELLIRLDESAPGIAHLSLRLYLYGRQAPEALARAESAWSAWLR